MSNTSKNSLQNNKMIITRKKTDETKIIAKANESRKEDYRTAFADGMKIPKDLCNN